MKHFLIILLLLPAVINAQTIPSEWLAGSRIVPTDSIRNIYAYNTTTINEYTVKYDTVKAYMLTSGRYVRTRKGYCITYKGWCTGQHLSKCRKPFRRVIIIWACRQFSKIYVTH